MIDLLSTRLDLSFALHRFANFSANPGKVNSEVLVHIFGYISDNKTLGLKCYADMNDAPVSDLLRQASIKTENHLMTFSDSSWQYFQILAEVQEHTLYFIKVGQLTMAHMLQAQFLNQLQKVSTMQHAQQE